MIPPSMQQKELVKLKFGERVKNVKTWVKQNGLILNPQKCALMRYGNKNYICLRKSIGKFCCIFS